MFQSNDYFLITKMDGCCQYLSISTKTFICTKATNISKSEFHIQENVLWISISYTPLSSKSNQCVK